MRILVEAGGEHQPRVGKGAFDLADDPVVERIGFEHRVAVGGDVPARIGVGPVIDL